MAYPQLCCSHKAEEVIVIKEAAVLVFATGKGRAAVTGSQRSIPCDYSSIRLAGAAAFSQP
jgi:hypothetical protein